MKHGPQSDRRQRCGSISTGEVLAVGPCNVRAGSAFAVVFHLFLPSLSLLLWRSQFLPMLTFNIEPGALYLAYSSQTHLAMRLQRHSVIAIYFSMMTLSLDMSTSLLTKHTQEHYFPIITPLSTSSYSPSAFNLHRGTIQPESLSQRCIRDSGIVAMANIRDFQEPFTPQPDQLTSDPKLLNP